MKKVFAIIAILVVVVGMVFADTTETHKLTVTTEVKGLEPVFQLYYSASVKTNDTRAVARTAPDSAEGEDFSTTTYTDADVLDKTAVDISKNPVTATVVAKLTGNVKLAAAKTYQIEFKADSLASDHTHALTVNGQAATYYIAPTVSGSEIAAKTAADGLDDGITMGNPSALAVTSGTLAGTITATMDTTNIQPCDLASFTFNYPATDEAPVDTYSALIWMIVSAS
jgi:Tfp pilus assembly protein FimT